MRANRLPAQTEGMNLSSLSESLIDLTNRTAPGVIAVKSAPYRVVSGVVLPNGIVAVTNHTLRQSGPIHIQTSDGTKSHAVIAGREPRLDLAFLKIEASSLPVLPTAEPDSLKTGSIAAVIGMTTDVGPSVSLGILGAVGGPRRIWRGGSLDHFFRLDVNIYPSQSGAAVVNPEGQLIGLATPALLRHSAVAIPVVTMNRLAEELTREGRIRHGYLGIGMQTVPIPAALREKLPDAPASALIALSVEPDSPAEKAGMQLGDILVSLDGKPTGDVEELQSILQGSLVGRSVKATLLRGGNVSEIEITISERPSKKN